MKSKQLTVVVLSLVLIILNILGVKFFSLQETRVIKLVSIILMLIVFLYYKGYKQKSILYVFLSFLMCDIFMLGYEDKIFSYITVSFLIIGYFFMILHVLPKIKFIRPDKYVSGIFIFLIIINVYMLLEIFNLLNTSGLDNVLIVMSYASGLIVMFTGFLVVGYNLEYNSIQSTYCSFFVGAFILSLIFNAMAYYANVYFFFYFSRLFYIVGFCIMTMYAILPMKKEENMIDEGFN